MILYFLFIALLCFVVYVVADTKEFGLGFLFGMVGLMLICLFISSSIFVGEKEYRRENVNYDIYSLKTDKDLSGSFVLGTGGIHTNNYYYAYYKDQYDAYCRATYDVNTTRIVEISPDKQPYAHYQIIYSKCPWWLLPEWIGHSKRKSHTRLYVPENTIIKTFRVE